jgi:uncharacterized protein YjbI with pentapeptide repeats
MGASLAGAILSGADLTDSCLSLADVSGATFDGNTKIDETSLLKACVRPNAKGGRQEIIVSGNEKI